MKIAACVFALTLALCQAASTQSPTECMSDADCLETQCCYKKHDFLVVSKKRQDLNPSPVLDNPKGVCQNYQNEGDICSSFDKANGFCSCNDKKGLMCQFSTQDNKQDQLYMHGFGVYRCAKAPLAASKK